MSILSTGRAPRREWPGTRWSAVSHLADHLDPLWGESWTWLFQNYQKPMESYVHAVLRRCGAPQATADKAEEIVASFVEACMSRDMLRSADGSRGKFRAFIQTALKRYTYSVLRKESTQKASPGVGSHTFDIREDDASTEDPTEAAAELEAFNQAWVRVARERALQRLRDENTRDHEMIIDLLATDGVGSSDLPERWGVRKKYVAVIKHRAKKNFEHHFKEEFAETVSGPEDFAEEWMILAAYLP